VPASIRYQIFDVLRGIAIVLMVYYHFSWDLNHFGLVRYDFYHDPWWLHLRTLIVSLFLGLVGVSLVLAASGGIDWRRWWRRLGALVFFALAITLVTWVQNAERVVVFGILHFIAFASVAGLVFLRGYWTVLAAGVAMLAAGNLWSHPIFDRPALHWLGLMTHKPVTEDYVPVLPWMGVVLLGMFLGRSLERAPRLRTLATRRSERLPARALALAGRHSLLIYVTHQPVLYGLFAALLALRR